MTTRTYTAILTEEPEEGGYSVTVPALPGLATQGESIDDALANAKEAIALYLDALRADGEPLPDDVTAATLAVKVAEPASAGA